jgi:hypothetical protein
LLVFAALVWRLRRRGEVSVLGIVVAAVTCVYGAKVLNEVLLPFPIRVGTDRDGLAPWQVFVGLTPTFMADPIGVLLNAVMFVPLGVLLPLIARVRSARRAVLIGFLLSLTIELVQFAADVTISTARIVDIDDLWANTLGTLIGYAIFRVVVLLPGAARIVERVPALTTENVDARLLAERRQLNSDPSLETEELARPGANVIS